MTTTKVPQRLGSAASMVLVVCAVVLTGLAIRRELFRWDEGQDSRHVSDWKAYAAEGQRSGAKDGTVTVVVFSDFQCPACRLLAEHLARIGDRNPGLVTTVFRHFPIASIHPHAKTAAQASECAGRQQRFGSFHDALFRGQDSIGVRTWIDYASEAGVPDREAFGRCMAEAAPAVLQVDAEAAKRLGVVMTPTLLINGRFLEGTPQHLEELERMVLDAADD